jgi:heterodisulfide reductase subunit A-like polyferredoxin
MKKPKFITDFADIPTERQKMPELPLDERKGSFEEVELGFTEEMVLKEAARCLSCRRCIGCGLCLAECDPEAVVYDEEARVISLEANSVILTSDAETYDPAGKRELGYASCANVITSLEFERLVSPTGPFGGYLLKPFDGDRPRKIAFIQCVGSRDEAIGANYCSVACCSRTISQARLAREQLGRVEVKVFHKGMRPIGKRGEVDFREIESADWIELIETTVTEVQEDKVTGSVEVLHTHDGKEARDTFDMVVLAVGVRARREFRRFGRVAGLKTNKFGFVERRLTDMVAGQNRVGFAGAVGGPVSAEASIIEAMGTASKALSPELRGKPEVKKDAGDRPAIFVCEYGLGLAGKDRGIVASLEAGGIETAGIFPMLCYRQGRAAMAEKINGCGGVIVVGCHRRSHEDLFERILGLPGGSVTIVGAHEIDDEAGKKFKAHMEDFPHSARGPKPASSTVAVLGGGISGLASAAELLRRGVEVLIIERSAGIGKSLKEALEGRGDDTGCAETLVKGVQENPRARVLLSSKVTSVERTNGDLSLKIATQDGEEAVRVGALLLATGTGRYEPAEYPYGSSESVMDQSDFQARIGKGDTPWDKVVMIQCVGARDAEHPYCSRYCCKQAISNALLYKSNRPEAEVTILHKGIRVFGFEEDMYTEAIEKGVSFVHIDGRPGIEEAGGLRVSASSKAGPEIALDADVVVLSLAHTSGRAQEEISRITGAPLDELGFFVSGNPVTDPFTTPAQGIFVCGFARAPVIAEEAFAEGVGAAAAIWRRLGS